MIDEFIEIEGKVIVTFYPFDYSGAQKKIKMTRFMK